MTKEYKRYSLTYTLVVQEEIEASDVYSAMVYAEQQSKLDGLTYDVEIWVEEMITNQDGARNRGQIAKWHLERVKEALQDAPYCKTTDLLAKLEDELENELEALAKYQNTGA